MSDSDDYMSSTFLDAAEDVCPGLVFSRQIKRKYEIELKKDASHELHKTKSRKQLETESRKVGLDTAISSNNKGFAILTKMGYKPGMKLGLPEEKNSSFSGLVEPIRIEIKSGRGGLGREEEIRKKISQLEERKSEYKMNQEKERERLAKAFQDRMRQKMTNKHLIADLNQSQKVCEQLDTENKVCEPIRPWFWYLQELSDSESETEDEIDDEMEPEEKLTLILDYLKGKYFFCMWCGVKYDSEEDLIENCPGPKKDDHDA